MTLRRITIENVKGIDAKTFDLEIIPNKPSILVAPNGFGKSSLAVAFSSLQTNRIALAEEHLYQRDAARQPRIAIDYLDMDGNTVALQADSTSSTISRYFDVFVINNQVKAKGTGRSFGGHTHVSASMAIEPVILVDTIPARQQFDYSYRTHRNRFGNNGRVLPNIGGFFDNRPLIDRLSDMYDVFDHLQTAKAQAQIRRFKETVNAQSGTTDELHAWITASMIGDLDSIEPLRDIAQLVLDANTGVTSRAQSYLAAIQLAEVYLHNRTQFKAACKYSNYLLEKEQYTSVLTAFNTSWMEILPRERKGKLVVEFPQAHYISNGQRDVLSFVALLNRARRKLRKPNSILVIDEVFDYLDEANLTAAQYYVTEFIDTYRRENRRIYPLILTHLNPYYFKNFAFSKQKTYFLDKRSIVPNDNLVRLLRLREDESIRDDVSQYLLHYHPISINRREDFSRLGLKETWGESDNFDRFLHGEIGKYRNDQDDYDPLAVCCSVRKRIERLIYDQLSTEEQRTEFLGRHTTKDKLAYAEETGVFVPEYYYLLGIIYNDGMHWKTNRDNISPIAAKLENSTLASLIKGLY